MAIGTTAALLGIAAATAGSQVASGAIASKGAKDAAKTLVQGAQDTIPITKEAVEAAQTGMTGATGEANQLLDAAAQQQLEAFKPYIDAGKLSVEQALNLINSPESTSQFSWDPTKVAEGEDYKFALAEGEKALNRSKANQGRLFSGAAAKDLLRFNTGLTGQFMGDYFNRAKDTFLINKDNATRRVNQLLDLTRTGLTGVSQGYGGVVDAATRRGINLVNSAQYTGDAGLRGSQQITDAVTGAASARAGGQAGSSNAWSTTLSNVGGIGQSIADYLMMRDMSNRRRLATPPLVPAAAMGGV